MRLNEYQKLSKRTLPKRENEEARKSALSNYAMGLAGESGEVVDLLKKHVHHGHGLDREELLSELGDSLHYLSGLATMCGISLGEVAKANIEKLEKRYPNGFSETDSINRSE